MSAAADEQLCAPLLLSHGLILALSPLKILEVRLHSPQTAGYGDKDGEYLDKRVNVLLHGNAPLL
jgi:hypothetical protein